MITLRLFRQSEPARQIDSYIMGDSEVTVGRDPNAVWVIDDPDRQLSRFHCTISARNGHVFVRDTSANGVYLGADGKRLQPSTEIGVPAGETLRLGQLVVVVDAEQDATENNTDSAGSSTRDAPLRNDLCDSRTNAIPDTWTETEPHPQPQTGPANPASEAVMLEAFCEGANLDPSYLTSEDPTDVMRRVGEIYQQLVLGLGDLMSDRASVKSDYSLERTTIGATDNNPLKWAPTHRLAVDLISERTGSFLKGADAVKECFEDLKGHSLCLVAGSRAVVSAVLEEFDPKKIEAEAKTPLFMERSEASWRRMKALHADVASDPYNNAESIVNVAFRRGYEQCASDLETKEPTE